LTLDIHILDDFDLFFKKFAETKSEARNILNISVQLHMLRRLVDANMLEVSKALGRDGEPIVYHVKEEFGGRQVCEYDALYGCTIHGKWALQIQSLFKSVLQAMSRRMTR